MYDTREEWLNEAVRRLDVAVFGQEMPKSWRISCGQGFGHGTKVLGSCWPAEMSADDAVALFISPALSGPLEVLGVLVHEMIHAVVGCEEKHGGQFKQMALKLEMSKPMRSTLPVEGTALWTTLEGIAGALGRYPHGSLGKSEKPKKESAIMTFISTEIESYTVSASMSKVIDLGFPRDPNGVAMVPKDQDRFDRFVENATGQKRDERGNASQGDNGDSDS